MRSLDTKALIPVQHIATLRSIAYTAYNINKGTPRKKEHTNVVQSVEKYTFNSRKYIGRELEKSAGSLKGVIVHIMWHICILY